MTLLKITVGKFVFTAKLEEDLAPKTCAAFEKHLPFEGKMIHVRWSGEATWIPLGNLDFGISFENNTSHPSKGEVLLYPGVLSETEILFPYGSTMFSSKVGQIAGNHFLTIVDGIDKLAELGHTVLWEGAQDLRIEKLL